MVLIMHAYSTVMTRPTINDYNGQKRNSALVKISVSFLFVTLLNCSVYLMSSVACIWFLFYVAKLTRVLIYVLNG